MGMYQEKPPLPFTPGVELCGEIVEHRPAGHRLAVRRPAARFAEYALMDDAAAFAAPDGHVRREGRLAAT